MTNTTVKTVVKQVQRRVIDEDAIRWTSDDMLDYLNSAIKAILAVRPDAYVLNHEFVCVAGTEQKLTERSNFLINVVRNDKGKAIRGPHDMLMLDNYYPEWRNSTPGDEADCYLYEERDPKVFYLYPAVKDQHKIQIIEAAIPEDITQSEYTNDVPLLLGPLYDNALIEYMVYLAFSQDNEFAANSNKANLALAAFNTILGNKNQSDAVKATSNQRAQNKPR